MLKLIPAIKARLDKLEIIIGCYYLLKTLKLKMNKWVEAQ